MLLADAISLLGPAGIGLGAGLIGGLAGIGGSMLIIPALGAILGYPRPSTQHLYMGAAMACNVVVAFPSALRHAHAGAIDRDLLRVLAPFTTLGIIAGVVLSSTFPGWWLLVALGAFNLLYIAHLLRHAILRTDDDAHGLPRHTRARLGTCGITTGLGAGLLGLGGGVIQVPLLQVLCNTPLRRAIGTSSAVMCITAVIGAALKLATLSALGESALEALRLAGVMAPTAIAGAWLGATLTHRLPITLVRLFIAALLLIASLRLIERGGSMGGWW